MNTIYAPKGKAAEICGVKVMKAISLWQPWASLMALGLKKIETRSWKTDYRGPLLIHAARKAVGIGDVNMTIIHTLDEVFPATPLLWKVLWKDLLPSGGIIATVDLVDCVRIGAGTRLPAEPERSFGDYTPGRFMWMTENVRAFKKIIPFRGRQRLFEIPDEALRVCRVCGCSEFNACKVGCHWVTEDLCSACYKVAPIYGPSLLQEYRRLKGNIGGLP